MGLAASQARYLFISSRINQVEAGMMNISAKEMNLTYKSDDIAEKYNYSLNQTHLAFNGEVGFNYDSLMGEDAMNSENGIYFLSNKDEQVVLSPAYAAGAKAAGVEEKGNTTESLNGQVAFLKGAIGAPTKANDWKEVLTGKLSNTEAYQALDTFKTDFGKAAPANTILSYDKKDVTKTYSINDILSKMGNTNNFNGISNLDGKSTKGTQTLNEQTNVSGTFDNLVKGQGYVCLVDDKEDLSYAQIWSRAQKGFTNLANNIVSKIASAIGVTDLGAKLQSDVQQMANGINGNLGQSKSGKESKARNGGRDTAMNGLIGVAVDDTATDQVWVYCNASELTRRLLTAAANKVNSQGASNPAARTNLQNGTTTLSNNSQVSYVVKEDDYTKPNYAKNEQGKTYAEWTEEWARVTADLDQTKAKEYFENGSVAVTIDEADKTKAANYLKIYSEICTKGWTEDADVTDSNKLANKLNNLTYKVNGKSVNNMAEFEQVKIDEEQALAKQEYESALNAVNREEKKLEVQKNQLQTELTSLTTEEASIKSIIDKNVERGFSLWS